jgi:phosphatidylserine/phosphatidylglycerophosphate/cardiolipin synthase-like enzyme
LCRELTIQTPIFIDCGVTSTGSNVSIAVTLAAANDHGFVPPAEKDMNVLASFPRRTIGLIAACLLLSACSLAPPRFGPPEPLPRPTASTERSCPASHATRCSISSPLQDAADRLEGTSGGAHRVTIVDEGDAALALRVHLIRAARRSIELQTFIWADDESGTLIFTELLAAAKRGVKVRLIADQPFSGSDPETLAWAASAHANLKMKVFNPIKSKARTTATEMLASVFFRFDEVNHRMHNKVIIVDNRIGLTGGRNIQNKYFDRDLRHNFYDRDVLVIGAEVANMTRSFDEYWADPICVDLDQLSDVNAELFADGQPRSPSPNVDVDLSIFDRLITRATDSDYIRQRFVATSHPVDRVKFKADQPQKGFKRDTERDRDISADMRASITDSSQSILMQTPYLVLSDPALEMLSNLRASNPKAQITVSTNSLATTDAPYVYGITFKHKKRYVKGLGLDIYEVKPAAADIRELVPRYERLLAESRQARASPPTQVDESESGTPDFVPVEVDGPIFAIHQKSMVIDNKISIIGSHNFDPRSVAINTEASLVVWDEAFAGKLTRSIRRLTKPQNAWLVARRQDVPIIGHISGLFASISRLLPFFDIWPFRYTSSFELIEGMEPVPRDDPRFYEHFRDVGQFPEVNISSKQAQTRIVSGFGAIFEPLM